MNEQNFEYLKDQLKYTGFGESLSSALGREMLKGEPSFQLALETNFHGKPFAAVLNFRKSEESGMYFFNSYHASLQRSNGELMDQAFYLSKGKGITAKEAYNLLEGRSVFKELHTKEGAPYKAWIQLNLEKRDGNNNHEVKQFHEAYGFNLKEAISRFPVAELKEGDHAEALISSLQKGNLQGATIERAGGVEKVYLEANPQYKTLTMYNSDMKRVPREELPHYGVKVTGEKELKEGVKKSRTDGGKNQAKGERGSDGLLQKTRKSKNKGVHP